LPQAPGAQGNEVEQLSAISRQLIEENANAAVPEEQAEKLKANS
jgi:hypothetical protein